MWPPFVLGCSCRYWLDKYRLVAVCRKPRTAAQPLRANLVLIAAVMTSLGALVSYPNGAGWIMGKWDLNKCNVFECFTCK